jgi:D-alanine--poly(phosphoribitol) ligase subunit 2
VSTAQKVLDVLVDVLKVDGVRDNLEIRLYDQHILDSLGTIRLMVALEEAFGVEFNDVELEPEEWATPSHIVKYMQRKLGQ